ncbi:hypothetical protein B0O99DRAFT_747953 [Bisporella sp. PMI_857]|nr:hypothetical protein B0O99DRAFT_747953 [Bisporella sp. PMI_857]
MEQSLLVAVACATCIYLTQLHTSSLHRTPNSSRLSHIPQLPLSPDQETYHLLSPHLTPDGGVIEAPSLFSNHPETSPDRASEIEARCDKMVSPEVSTLDAPNAGWVYMERPLEGDAGMAHLLDEGFGPIPATPAMELEGSMVASSLESHEYLTGMRYKAMVRDHDRVSASGSATTVDILGICVSVVSLPREVTARFGGLADDINRIKYYVHGLIEPQCREDAAAVSTQKIEASDQRRYVQGTKESAWMVSWMLSHTRSLANVPVSIACLSDPTGIVLFIDPSTAQRAVEEVVLGGSQISSLTKLAYAVLAIGARAQSIAQFSEADAEWAAYCFRFALAEARSYRCGRASVLDFQSIVALLYYADTYGLPATSELLWESVRLALDLRLNREQAIETLPISDHERCLVQQAFWYLYALDKRLMIRTGRACMLYSEFIDHTPYGPSAIRTLPEGNLETPAVICSLYQYGELCSRMVHILYETISPGIMSVGVGRNITCLYQELVAWKDAALLRCTETQTRSIDHIRILSYYYEMSLVLYSKWWDAMPATQSEPEWCLSLLQGVVDFCGSIVSLEENLLDANLYTSVVCLATAGIFIIFSSACHGRYIEKWQAYLVILTGIYGRLSLKFLVPLAEISRISSITQDIARGTQ